MLLYEIRICKYYCIYRCIYINIVFSSVWHYGFGWHMCLCTCKSTMFVRCTSVQFIILMYLRIPKISLQFYYGRYRIAMHPETSVEIGKSFRCWRILKLNSPLGKLYDVVVMVSDICNIKMQTNEFLLFPFPKLFSIVRDKHTRNTVTTIVLRNFPQFLIAL